MNSDERRINRYKRRKAKRDRKREEKIGCHDSLEVVADGNALVEAFYESKREVSWKASVQRYEMNLLRNTLESKKKLERGENVSQGFIEFSLSERGKTRRIKSVHIKERCIQRSLCDNVLVPTLQRGLIYDNGASMRNKGIHFALNRMDAHLHQYYRDNGFSNEGYILLIDFSGYFDNILHEPIYNLLRKEFKDERILNLSRQLIEPFDETGEGKSLGIGSQISQILAVRYPTEIDMYVKQKLHIRYYGRYMDDSYLIHHDKEYLKQCLEEMKILYAKYGIIINTKKTQIVKLSKGFTFLKIHHILTESGKIIKKPCKDSIVRERRKLKKLKKKLDDGVIGFEDIECQYSSWRGYISYTNSYNTVKRMDNLFDELFIEQFKQEPIEPIRKKPSRLFYVERMENNYGKGEESKVFSGE
jgi:hypothetical protein